MPSSGTASFSARTITLRAQLISIFLHVTTLFGYLINMMLARHCRPISRVAAAMQCLHTGAGPAGPVAFVFDIDGVLLRGEQPLPGAAMALQLVRVPACCAAAVA